MTKIYAVRNFLVLLSMSVLITSCLTVKEGKYISVNYDDLVEKEGDPLYTLYQTVDKNYLHSDFEPNFSKFFTDTELEASVTIRYASWKKTHSALMVWFKNVDDEWIVFSSIEYKKPFIK